MQKINIFHILQLATKPRTQDVLNPMFLNNVLNKAIQLSINSDDKYADNLSFLLKFFPKSLKLMGKSIHCRVTLLTHFVPMEFPIKFDTVKSGWSIVYIEGSQVIISEKYCISFSEDWFCLGKQCRPWWNATICGISSGSSLFSKIPI